MSRRKQQKPRHLEADQELEGILDNGVAALEGVEHHPEEGEDMRLGDAHVCGICRGEFLELADFVAHKATCSNKRVIVPYGEEGKDEEADDLAPPPTKVAKMAEEEETEQEAYPEKEDLNESELVSQSSSRSDLGKIKDVEDEGFYTRELNNEDEERLGEDVLREELNEESSQDETPSESDIKEERDEKSKDDDEKSPFLNPLASLTSMAALLPDNNVKLEALDSTKVAVAQFVEEDSEDPKDLSNLQNTLFSLQQQQLFQLQMLQQIQNQLVMGMAPSLANIPPNLIPPQLANLANMGLQLPGITGLPLTPGDIKSKSPTPTTPSSNKMSDGILSPTIAREGPDDGSTPSAVTPKREESLGDGLRTGPPAFPPPPLIGSSSPLDPNDSINFFRKGKPPNVTVGTPNPRDYVADDPFFKHKCRFCHKVFGSDSALQIHIRSHTGERPFKCNICGNRFSTRGNLKVHFARHKEKYPHVKMNPNPVPEHLDRLERSNPSAPSPLPPQMMLPPFSSSPNTSTPKAPTLPPSLLHQTPLSSQAPRSPPPPERDQDSKVEESKQVTEPNESSTCPITLAANSRSSPGEAKSAQPDSASGPSRSPYERERAISPSGRSPMMTSPSRGHTPMGLPGMSLPMPFLPMTSMAPSIMAMNGVPRPSMPSPGMPLPTSMPSPHNMPPFGFPGDTPPFFRPSILPSKLEDPLEQYMEVDKSETNKLQQLVDNIESKLTDPNQCAICHRILSCKSALQMHYRTHTGERPFKCKICGRAFTTKGNLKTHMGVHRAKPPVRMLHQCPVCHKQFTNALVLQQHIRMHTGELPKDMPPHEVLGSLHGMPFLPFPAGLPFLPPGFAPPMGMNGELDLRKSNDKSPYDDRKDDRDEDSRDDDDAEISQDGGMTRSLSEDEALNRLEEESYRVERQREEDERNADNDDHENQKSPSEKRSDSPKESLQETPRSSYLRASDDKEDLDSDRMFGGSRPLEQMANILRRQENEYNDARAHNGHHGSPAISPRSGNQESPDVSKSPRSGHSPRPSSAHSSLDGSRDLGPFGGALPPHGFGPVGFSSGPFDGKTNTTCNICFKTFACRSALDIHYRSHTKERPFRCDVCDRGFSTRGNMKQHMLTHKIRDMPGEDNKNSGSEGRGEDEQSNDSTTPPTSKANSPRASIANTPTSSTPGSGDEKPGPPPPLVSSSPLSTPPSSHSTSHGTNSSSRIGYDSPNSSSPFVKRPNLKHVCQMCHKPFSSASALQIHIRTHTGDKPFKCTVCGKAFTTKGNLKVHMGTHMWNNTPSRRGRRMSIDTLPQGMIPSPKDADFFNNFAQRPPAEMFPYPFPGYPGSLIPKMNEISVIQSMNGAMGHLPPGFMPPRLPTQVPTSEAMIKSEDTSRGGKEEKPMERNNNTPSGASGELDLSIRKPSPSSANADSSDQGDSPKSSSWMWKSTCQLCNKSCSSESALEVHMQSHLRQADQASPKPLMT